MYEPVERFEHLGKSYFWNPDCILVHERKVYVVELQLSPLGVSRWRRKWTVYEKYFGGGYFEAAAFQRWAKRPIMPQFLVISGQQPDTVRQGWAVEGRELIITGTVLK